LGETGALRSCELRKPTPWSKVDPGVKTIFAVQ
jgi:hypothetical protein